MQIKTLALTTISIFFLVNLAFANTKSKEDFARQVISNNQSESNEAIKYLRSLGKEGLDTLFQTYSAEINKFSAEGKMTENWQRISLAIDSVAMQKDAYAAHLFWFTDLAEAKRVAAASNKPILSLRLLGNLNEEFSCANSRFFRAILYPNAEISKYLQENYVLHWKSVRPAPKVTIDFGDGRKIERTLTGNSIHYILDTDGKIIDALPGLYSPQSFLKYLRKSAEIKRLTFGLSVEEKDKAFQRFQRSSFNLIKTNRDKTVADSGVKLVEPKSGTGAIDVALRAITKMVTEVNILQDINDSFARYEPAINFEDWKKLAKVYAGNTKLDASSIAFIRRQNAKSGLSEAEFTRLLTNLENYMAIDTARNDFFFHPKLFEMLNQNTSDVETFNAKVYTEIFKTPNSDKWLGLYSTDVYTALDDNGIIK